MTATPGAPRNMPRGRSWARRYAMQALYQWQLNGQGTRITDTDLLDDDEQPKADTEYFHELLEQVQRNAKTLDAVLDPCLDRPIVQLDPVERAILWVAAYELMHRMDVPYRVVINEAVELAKRFGAEQGHRFVNGVLDKIARQHRPEFGATRRT